MTTSPKWLPRAFASMSGPICAPGSKPFPTEDRSGRFVTLASGVANRFAPFAVLDLHALDANADDLVRRAGGKPIRLASKSVRCRAIPTSFHSPAASRFPSAWPTGWQPAPWTMR